jgi:hypothetical protein
MGGLLSIVFPVYVALVDPEMIRADITAMLVLFVVFAALTVSTMAFVSHIAARKWKKLEVRVLEDRIERQWDQAVDKISYETVRRVVVASNRSGKVIYIKVYSSTTAMYLFGFGRMDKMTCLIKQRISEAAEVKEKRLALDWSSPVGSLLMGLPLMLVIVLIFAFVGKLGRYATDALTAILCLAIGLLSFLYRPLSRWGGTHFKRYEIVLGVLLLIFGALMLTIVVLY